MLVTTTRGIPMLMVRVILMRSFTGGDVVRIAFASKPLVLE